MKLSLSVFFAALQVSTAMSMNKIGYMEKIIDTNQKNVFQKVTLAASEKDIVEINQKFLADTQEIVQKDFSMYTMDNPLQPVARMPIYFYDRKCTYWNRLDSIFVILFSKIEGKNNIRQYIFKNVDPLTKVRDLISLVNHENVDINKLYPYIAYEMSSEKPMMFNAAIDLWLQNGSSMLINLSNHYVSIEEARKIADVTLRFAVQCSNFCENAREELSKKTKVGRSREQASYLKEISQKIDVNSDIKVPTTYQEEIFRNTRVKSFF